MKKLIYLPLMAIVVLTGCKSNSFTTQRYTKFAHTSTNHTEERTAITKNQPVSAAEMQQIQPEGLVTNSNDRSLNETVLNTSFENTYLNTKGSDANSFVKRYTATDQKVKGATKISHEVKTVQQKKQTAKGLIGDVLGLVLSIIFIAIVIGLIIMLIVLV